MSGLFSQPLIIRFIREVGASEHNSVQTHSLAGQRASFLPSLLGHQSCRDWKFLVLKGRMEPSEADNFRYPPHEILSQSLGALPNWMSSRFALLVRFFCYFQLDCKYCKKILAYYWYFGPSISLSYLETGSAEE